MDIDITSSRWFDEGCPHFEEAKQTVFDHITQSVEALAEKLVYHIYLTDCMQRKRSYWRSTFFPCNNFATKEKAIAATVEELKKEYKKDDSGRN
jgi:hypothetical protein